MDNDKRIYSGCEIVLLTKHKKETVIQPLLEKETGCKVIVESRFDTDKLGTFSREIKRKQSQKKTALRKIKLGIRLTKKDIGVASEGSFGMHPYLSIPWNIEIVALFDRINRVLVTGVYESAQTNHNHIVTDNFDEALAFSESIGFPDHFVIVRPHQGKTKHIIKGINNAECFADAFYWSKTKSQSNKVLIETDMRAFANPTRMKCIEKATLNLITNINMICPCCGAPGFVVVERIKGLPCASCKMPGESILKNIHKCQKCKHVVEEMYPQGRFSSPQYCHHCNP